MNPTFFTSPLEFREWLERHHDDTTELLLGFYKKKSGREGIGYPEAVDEALCFGWIDGIRRRIDEIAYSIRFTPRKPTSIWSNVNIARVEELTQQGRMRPSGLNAFERRRKERSGVYTYENDHLELDDAYEEELRANGAAWAFFCSQPPWYRRTASRWLMSAKKEETRRRRLTVLIDCSERNVRIPPLSYGPNDRRP
jgi:uncharacterized protein YdeI (YjbR/CyaY-like superfamily)